MQIREKLSSIYSEYAKYILFNTKDSVEFIEGGYKYRKTGEHMYINDFTIDFISKNVLIMSWNRVGGNVGGSFYKIRMKSKDGKLIVKNVTLIGNS